MTDLSNPFTSLKKSEGETKREDEKVRYVRYIYMIYIYIYIHIYIYKYIHTQYIIRNKNILLHNIN